MSYLILDIETKPKTADELSKIEPQFRAPSTWKDQVKIAAAIEEKRQAWVADAALSPLTGDVQGVTIGSGTDLVIVPEANERTILELVQARLQADNDCPIVGFNFIKFDLRWLFNKALLYRMDKLAFDIRRRQVCDVMVEFNCGLYGEYTSLDNVLKFFGYPCKTRPDGKLPYQMTVEERREYMTSEALGLKSLYENHFRGLISNRK